MKKLLALAVLSAALALTACAASEPTQAPEASAPQPEASTPQPPAPSSSQTFGDPAPLRPEDFPEKPFYSQKEIEIMNAYQPPALTSYDEFQEQLDWDDTRGYLYPDTFAGAWVDRENWLLCMALTDCSAKVTAEYDKYFSRPDAVVYVQAEHSYNDLWNLKEEITASCDGWSSAGVDQRDNVVSIGAATDEAIQHISEKYAGLPVEVHYEGYAVLN